MHDGVSTAVIRWNRYISEDWIREMDSTSFLSRCRSGVVSRQELDHFLVQQYYYARNFTRFLCALLSNIENEADRQALTVNLIDEMGLGTIAGVPHSALYRKMLERMEIDPGIAPLEKATQALIDAMLESCKSGNILVGLGALCLGAEAIVPHLYGQIVTGFHANGFSKADLEFFYIHMECDDDHALTMKMIIDQRVGSPRELLTLQSSARRALSLRARFFHAILQPREVPSYAVL